VSDDLSIEQLMCCENAERILAKRHDALQSLSPSPAMPNPSPSGASSPKIQPSAPASASEDTPRSSRLLLFVQAIPAAVIVRSRTHSPLLQQGIIEPMIEQLARKPLLPAK
jgi:hypothetical protein